jgi:cell division control protein 7
MHAPPHYLSNHSSNPLQVPSDDPLNSLYFERVRPSLQREKFGHVRGASNSSLGSATPRARANVLSLHNSSPIPLEANDDDDELLLVETQDDEVVPETDQRPSFDDMEERGANDEIDFGDEYEAIEEVTGYVPLDQDDLSPDVDQDEEFRDDESEDNEEHTLELKSKEDRLEIEEEMKDLENTVSSLKEDYKLLDRLGEGEFFVERHVDKG